jgi:hypothetical protein
VFALNLTLSPENYVFWDCADPLIIGAGETEGALRTSTDRHPGVADSIEPDNDVGVTRRASENYPKVLGESIPGRGDSNRVWSTNVKGGGQKMPMRGMETSVTAMV